MDTIQVVKAPRAMIDGYGPRIDYVEDMIGASFQIKNPNAKSSCGCGNSFSV